MAKDIFITQASLRFMSNKWLLGICLALISLNTQAQEENNQVLTFSEYMEIVMANHPLAIQADLEAEGGKAALQRARGNFDPKIAGNLSEKNFKGDEYYRLIDAGLKVPTWFGMEVVGGYEQNQGVYLNAENTTPVNGLVYAGLSMPIGQGLLIDYRRAELRKAQLFQEVTELERLKLLNELYFEAGKVYWDWFYSYHTLKIFEEALELAQIRFDGVKQQAAAGFLPMIDTLEAGIQVQDRTLNFRQAQLDFTNSTLLASVYLWSEGFVPLELDENLIPNSFENLESLDLEEAFAQWETMLKNHPLLQQLQLELEMNKIDRRWKQEQLKPIVNLKYNALAESLNNDLFTAYSNNNFTYGISVQMPLFLRKERAELKLAKFKIQSVEAKFAEQGASLNFQAQAALNEVNTIGDQVSLYRRTVEDYLSLLEGERQKFAIGESSLFLVNSRELGYINSQIKLMDLVRKQQKSSLKVNYVLVQGI
ncbi:TolC family protein [Fulvivirgaceae bacterium LMO-SS25]